MRYFFALIIIFIALPLLSPGYSLAAGDEPVEIIEPKINIPIPTLPSLTKVEAKPGKSVSIPWIAEYIIAIYRYLVIIGAVIATLLIMVGGIMYLLAGGMPSNIEKAKGIIINAIAGLGILLFSHLLLEIINPNLVKLKSIEIQTIEKETIVFDDEFASEPISPADQAGQQAPAGSGSLPNFKQCASGWNSYSYKGSCTEGKNTICSSGCGITSIAMILSYYGKGTEPPKIADWLLAHNYRQGSEPPKGATCSGISHEAISQAASAWGLKMEKVDKTKAQALLAQNIPIITHVRNKKNCGEEPSTCKFTKCGHYIVLKSYKDGVYGVNDPGSSSSNRTTGTDSELFQGCDNKGLIYVHQ